MKYYIGTENAHTRVYLLCIDTAKFSQTEARHGPQIRANRMKISAKLPTLEEIAILKHKKKVLSHK